MYANGPATTPTLSLTGTTNHGSSCIGAAATSQTYTITNNGSVDAEGVTVVSNNAQFVVSGLSSTIVTAGGGTATYNVTFTPTSAGVQAATVTVSSTTSGSNSPTSSLTGTGVDTVSGIVATNTATSITSSSATLNGNVTKLGTCPNTIEKGFVYAVQSVNGTPVNGGTGVTTSPNATLGSQGAFTQAVSGLAEGTTYAYQAYLFDGTTYTYGGVQTFQTTVTAPTNVTNTKACLTDTGGIISWTAPSTLPYGYMVFAVAATTAGTGTPTTPIADYTTVNTDFSLATTYGTLGKLLYKGNATSVNISGLTENTVYSFRVFSYNQGAEIRSFSSGATAGSKAENAKAQDDVNTFTGTPSNTQVTLNWTYNSATSCFDEVVIIANQGAVTFTPTGDGSAYTADDTWNNAGEQVVYKGTANSKAVYNLTNETEYCFKIFVRRGTEWSDGVSVCVTPDITYCTSNGNTSYSTGVTLVNFNTINNATINTPKVAYNDFTSQSTTVSIGNIYPLTVNVDTDGNYTIYAKAWIDWNHNGDFNDSGEEYDLGSALNTSDGITSLSPLNITIPTNAYIGNTRIRISARYNSYPTSCATNFDGEVEDYTLSITQLSSSEINITGNGINIANGFDTPYGLNNTLFAATDLGNQSVEKEFIIQNLGLSSLSLTGTPVIELTGANPSDFIVTQQAASSVAGSSNTSFKIKFVPTVSGVRTAYVKILNNDSDENPYEFKIQGTGVCAYSYISSFLPAEGPSETIVSITSDADLTGAIVTFDGSTLSPITMSSSIITVQIPSGSTSDYITVTLANGCTLTHYFNVITSVLTDCATSGGANIGSDLFISQVTDSGTDAMTYVELYNNTGASINLSGYSLKIYNNGASSPTNTINLNSVSLPNDTAYVIVVGSNSPLCTGVYGGYGELANQSEPTMSGINFFKTVSSVDDYTLGHDYIALFNNSTKIDSWGVFEDESWAVSLNLQGKGANFIRKSSAIFPPVTYSDTDWNIYDWDDTCDTQDYSDIGIFVSSTKTPPTITVQPNYTESCIDSYTLSVEATEGVEDAIDLTYQWYVNTPLSNTWTEISGANTSTYSIDLNDINVYGNQYYVQVRENGVTCFTPSNAVMITGITTWTVSGWDSIMPTIVNTVVIDENYSTLNNGNLNACRLLVNTSKTITINNSGYAYVINNIVNNGSIEVENTGSLVQVNETNTNSGLGLYKVTKNTGTYYPYDYIYWSSPLSNVNIQDIFTTANGYNNYKYKFAPDKYNDQFSGIRTGAIQTGSNADGFDDEGDDWTNYSTGVMTPGIGYIVMGKGSGAFNPANTTLLPATDVTFTGAAVNNGVVTVPLYHDNFTGTDDDNINLNLVGNPYPSAISLASLANLSANTSLIEPNFYFWTHAQPISNSFTGPWAYNFSNNSMASATVSGSTVTTNAGSTGISGLDYTYIASGQAFFVQAKESVVNGSDVLTFNNSMRGVSHPNTNFLRTSAQKEMSLNRIWLSLQEPDGTENPIALGFSSSNTDGYSINDVYRIDSGNDTEFYSLIPGVKGDFDIQFLAPFSDDKTIPLGMEILKNGTYSVQLRQTEGIFTEGQHIYLEDRYEHIIHDFAEGSYNFYTVAGENINDRFVIRFTTKALNLDDNILQNLTLYPNPSTGVFYINYTGTETLEIEVFDVLGKQVLKRTNTNTVDLSAFNSGIYLAKFTTPSGNITKKLVRE